MAGIPRENLIISADDFGISSQANQNILKLIRVGKIDRVGILINGAMQPEEISELKKSKALLDIHLELNGIRSPKRKLKEGILGRSANFIFKYLAGKIGAGLAEIEWEKQKTKGAAVNAGFDVETLFLAKKMGFKIYICSSGKTYGSCKHF